MSAVKKAYTEWKLGRNILAGTCYAEDFARAEYVIKHAFAAGYEMGMNTTSPQYKVGDEVEALNARLEDIGVFDNAKDAWVNCSVLEDQLKAKDEEIKQLKAHICAIT